MKHVFILGAGFSVPLGGPLFAELLTTQLIHRTDVLNQSQVMRVATQGLHIGNSMRRVFEQTCGRESRDSYLDAERLIELVDWASRHTESFEAKHLLKATNYPNVDDRPDEATFLRQVLTAVKRVIAAQCEVWLDGVDSTSERWKPFTRWFNRLSQDDCIITFNYDTAVERIAEMCDRPFNRESLHLQSAADRPVLIKLHGSVDWRQGAKDFVYEQNAYLKECELAMGVPGEGKALLHNEGHFARLLGLAKDRIKSAERVSIIGYSMPPSDHHARMFILDALAVGKKREVDIVLGPAADTITARRMTAIIKPVVKARVTNHPMYAQDFLPNVWKYSGSMV